MLHVPETCLGVCILIRCRATQLCCRFLRCVIHHDPQTANSTLAICHCDAKTVGGMPCDGVMSLSSVATDVSGTSRETWECTLCHAREFHTVVEAVEVGEADEPLFFCTFCHNPYEPGANDAYHACESCTVWFEMQSVN